MCFRVPQHSLSRPSRCAGAYSGRHSPLHRSHPVSVGLLWWQMPKATWRLCAKRCVWSLLVFEYNWALDLRLGIEQPLVVLDYWCGRKRESSKGHQTSFPDYFGHASLRSMFRSIDVIKEYNSECFDGRTCLHKTSIILETKIAKAYPQKSIKS